MKIKWPVLTLALVLVSQALAAAETDRVATPRIGVQLWSVHEDLGRDFDGTLIQLAEMGFQGVEFAGVFGPYVGDPEALAALLDSLGLAAAGAHVGLDQLSGDRFEATVDFYRAIGCTVLIIPTDERAWNPERVDELIDDLNRLAERLAPLGMRIGYHNHAREFGDYQGTTYWDHIAEFTEQEVVLQLDVGWTVFAGKDPAEYVLRYPGRTVTTHYKAARPPGSPATTTVIGRDGFDWASLLQVNSETGGTRWIILEQEEYPDGLSPLEAVRMSKSGLDQYFPGADSGRIPDG